MEKKIKNLKLQVKLYKKFMKKLERYIFLIIILGL